MLRSSNEASEDETGGQSVTMAAGASKGRHRCEEALGTRVPAELPAPYPPNDHIDGMGIEPFDRHALRGFTIDDLGLFGRFYMNELQCR